MELIKKMYALMAQQEEGEEEVEEAAEDVVEPEDKEESGSMMAQAMDMSKKPSLGEDLDMSEVKEFLTKKKKSPVSKSLNIMAITKAPMKSFDKPKMKKYG